MIATNDIRFCKNRFDLYDSNGKNIAREWLTQLGFENIQENEEESKRNFKEIWDLKGIHSEFGEFRIEAEIKVDWGTKWLEIPFKYPTMDIPYRKRDKTDVHATHMMVIGGDLKRLFIIKRETMLNSPVGSKKCRNRNWAEEPFFQIPLPCDHSTFYFKKKEEWLPYKWN